MKREKIYFWPQWLAASWPPAKKPNRPISGRTLTHLSRAGSQLWRAINIYDDIRDGSADALKLPEANRYYRLALKTYYQLKLSADFYHLMDKLFKALERAEAEEMRSKSQWQTRRDNDQSFIRQLQQPLLSLADKSLPLALSPLALVDLISSHNSLPNLNNWTEFFRPALAAKQLSDDARDWAEDLANSHLTVPLVLMMKEVGDQRLGPLKNLDQKQAACLFSGQPAQELGMRLSRLCQAAKDQGEKIGLRKNSILIDNIIGPIERQVARAESFRKIWMTTLNKKTKHDLQSGKS